jgi:hypothetical protein
MVVVFVALAIQVWLVVMGIRDAGLQYLNVIKQ